MDNDADDDVPLSTLIAKKQTEVKTERLAVAAATVTTNSDSEDDLPISELIKRRGKARGAPESQKRKQNEEASTSKRPRNSSAPSGSNSSGGSRSSGGGGGGGGSGGGGKVKTGSPEEFYEKTFKGRLIHEFLKRWWYAYDWPLPEEIGTPPAGYESLDGFPGVFVSTQTDSLGKILDLRDKKNCPCFSNYLTKPSSEVKDLCILAIEKQIEALVNAEGKGTKLESDLKGLLSEMRRIDAAKADKEARSFIAENKLA